MRVVQNEECSHYLCDIQAAPRLQLKRCFVALELSFCRLGRDPLASSFHELSPRISYMRSAAVRGGVPVVWRSVVERRSERSPRRFTSRGAGGF